MSRAPLSPEALVLQFELAEMLELLAELGFESTPPMAAVFKQTLREFGCLDRTLTHFASHSPTPQAA